MMVYGFSCPGCRRSQALAVNAVRAVTTVEEDGATFRVDSVCPDCDLLVSVCVDHQTFVAVSLVVGHRQVWEKVETDRRAYEILHAEGLA
jgi:hypothetical protein